MAMSVKDQVEISSEKKTIFLVRHGDYKAWCPTCAQELTPIGIEQARATAKSKTISLLSVANIFSSCLLRARQTAEIISQDN